MLEVAGDSALRKIERAATVEASAISYDKRELLRLVHAHLMSSGLHRTAQVSVCLSLSLSVRVRVCINNVQMRF